MRSCFTADISMQNEYLTINVRSPLLRDWLLKRADATTEDVPMMFWGEDSILKTLTLVGVTTPQRLAIRGGQTIGKHVKISLLEEWVETRKRSRLYREDMIRRIDKVSDELSRFTLKEARLQKAAKQRVNSDTIPGMDGSAMLWLNVIISAKKDFLRYFYDQNRELNEDFTSARSFLFDDEYHILMDDPESVTAGTAKYVNLRDILSSCMEQWQRTNEGVDEAAEPSVELLRAKLARATGDPRLIACHCVQFDGYDKEFAIALIEDEDESLE